jgi:hypothetical protein
MINIIPIIAIRHLLSYFKKFLTIIIEEKFVDWEKQVINEPTKAMNDKRYFVFIKGFF